MPPPTALVLTTLDTKAAEAAFLQERLQEHGVTVTLVDTSLDTDGTVLGGPEKLRAMDETVARATALTTEALAQAQVVIGIGGGTGGEIALNIMRALPITFPKVLVTTLPFDPRAAAADTSLILVPTLADICGLNPTLREILENVAALTAGLCASRRSAGACLRAPTYGITALGATDTAVQSLVAALQARGEESTVFHSNGYGGGGFARFARLGAFHTIIDMTPHELTRLHVAGAHVPMPDRFSAGAHLPRIVLPGGLNFIGFGEASLLPEVYRARPHYAHSGFFTHVKLAPDEMARVADALVTSLNALTGPVALIVPMGGFSHQDAPGGAIEDRELREIFLDRARDGLRPGIPVLSVEAHITSPNVTDAILEACDRHRSTAAAEQKD
ncbi:MAG: Tm-1-like ATP-binding domain-containing protein [Pseudomonadota bacterium]